jgi:dipeptide/tripeptide permease
MNNQPATTGNDADAWDKVLAVCSAILGLLPPALTGFGAHFASLYNPPIYEHLEPFLIIPGLVAIFASWLVLTNRQKSMPIIFGLAFFLALVVLFVYLGVPGSSTVGSINVHALNWILSYCVVALGVALLFGFFITLKH